MEGAGERQLDYNRERRREIARLQRLARDPWGLLLIARHLQKQANERARRERAKPGKNARRRNGKAIPRPRPTERDEAGAITATYCSGCQTIRPVSEFLMFKSGSSAGHYRQNCRACLAALQARRRTRLVANGNYDLTRAQWRLILDYHGNTCAYCGVGGELTLDHVIPISQGGQHTAPNVVPACVPCNLGRRDIHVGQWFGPDIESAVTLRIEGQMTHVRGA